MIQNSINNKTSSLQIGPINISSNVITTSPINTDLNLTPSGSGKVNIENIYFLPSAAGGATSAITTNGSGTLSFLPSPFSSLNVQVFTVSGTYTPTSGMVFCQFECIAGGGGGGGKLTTSANQLSGSAGGMAGSYSTGIFTNTTIGASQTVTVGIGGTGGIGSTNTLATAGGNSSVGSLITAIAGAGTNIINGPAVNNILIQTAPENATTGSGGDINMFNGGGGLAFGFSDSTSIRFAKGGFGGTSFYGGGAKAIAVLGSGSSPGVNATGFGAGGSGAIGNNINAAENGGTGADGVVIITEYLS